MRITDYLDTFGDGLTVGDFAKSLKIRAGSDYATVALLSDIPAAYTGQTLTVAEKNFLVAMIAQIPDLLLPASQSNAQFAQFHRVLYNNVSGSPGDYVTISNANYTYVTALSAALSLINITNRIGILNGIHTATNSADSFGVVTLTAAQVLAQGNGSIIGTFLYDLYARATSSASNIARMSDISGGTSFNTAGFLLYN